MKKSKVLVVHGEYTKELEELLNDGWEVQHMTAYSENVSIASGYGITRGLWGMYVLLTKEEEEKKELTEEEVKVMLMKKGLQLWD